MSLPMYCSGKFVGQRTQSNSALSSTANEPDVQWSLCLTPTKDYPSVFGAVLTEDGCNIVHGTYNATTSHVQMTELINGVSTNEYRCQFVVDRVKRISYLHGTWKSLIETNQSGELALIRVGDRLFDHFSGIWIGEAIPDESLADFLLPINPIRWCLTMFRVQGEIWQVFGSGYFNDAADIPNQPLLFFSLYGKGTINEMKLIKKYQSTDYIVEYTPEQLVENQEGIYTLIGKWSNPKAGSFGSFRAEQCQLNPMTDYRLDLCICEVCTKVIYPGDSRWCCYQCHFSTCPGCNLNSKATAHPHRLVPTILPTQAVANGRSCYELINKAFKLFHASSLLVYRSSETRQLVRMTYGEMFNKCQSVAKYWKEFLGTADDQHRPHILLFADTSPAYICCLFAGLLCQAVVVPIHGGLSNDALQHLLSINDPSLIVVDEAYVEKISAIPSNKSQKCPMMIIYRDEEQFQLRTDDQHGIISLSTALRLGEQSGRVLTSSVRLSSDTVSAILSTSGSTGIPKGALFTEEFLIPNDTFTMISPFIRIDYQPFDPVLLLSLMSTIRYGSMRGITNLNEMWTDIREIKPTSLGLNPSLWNTLYKSYLSKLRRSSTDLERQEVAREMRESLGGRVIVGTSGGGSISPTVLTFIQNQLKIDLVDMYGCRECGNITRDGLIYPGIDIKLLPVPDMGLDGVEEGEICVHSPRMIKGYWGMTSNSSFIEIEGKKYYKTGDIGRLHGQSLKLLDRSGMMIKNSLAEWISPVKIENIIEQLTEVSTAFVIGDANYSYVAVIVCPSSSAKDMTEFDLLQLIRFHCVHCGLAGPEIPQRIYIERQISWNEQNGLMKEKKSRHALAKHYSQVKVNLFNDEFHHDSQHRESQQLSREFLDILENLLNRSLDGRIQGENTFLEIGADSLAVNLLCQIYKVRGIDLQPAIVYNHQLKHLDQILTHQHRIDDQIIDDIDWKSQWTLPDRLKTLISPWKPSAKKNILITGVTGFLGPLLLHEILAKTDPSVIVYCLIRANNEEHARQRLEQDLDKCQRKASTDWTRIRCLVANICKEDFDLSPTVYQQLIDEVGIIYHNASWVHLEMPYKALRRWNVGGTLNCLELALKCQARLIYTSSVAALPSSSSSSSSDTDGWVKLTWNEISRKDGYGQTKVVAEQLLHQASKLGANIVIVRPCTISADTQTGYSNTKDFINMLLRAQLEMNATVDNANLELHCVPVDYCARAMVALAMNEESAGKCFNLYGDGFNIALVYEALSNRLPHLQLKRIPQQQWKDFVFKNLSEKHQAWPLKDRIASIVFKHDDHSQRHVGVPTDMTRQFLQVKCNLPWFQVTQEDFRRSIDFMIQQGFLTQSVPGEKS